MNNLPMDIFNLHMTNLAEYIGCDLPEPHQLKYYYDEFKNMHPAPFLFMCDNVRREHKARWFPYISAFYAARQQGAAQRAHSDPPAPMPHRDQAWRDAMSEEAHRTVPQCIEENATRAKYVECCVDAASGSVPFTKKERDELWVHLGGESVIRGTWNPEKTLSKLTKRA